MKDTKLVDNFLTQPNKENFESLKQDIKALDIACDENPEKVMEFFIKEGDTMKNFADWEKRLFLSRYGSKLNSLAFTIVREKKQVDLRT